MSQLAVKQFINRELGNSSYLVGSDAKKLAVVIDPERDVQKYIEAAEERGWRIAYGLETHLHADFISGVHELAHALAARGNNEYKIAVSAAGASKFTHIPLHEGDRISLGAAGLVVMATPGHSREHISFLAYVEGQVLPLALFSGGSLIVGGTGRTDLHGKKETVPLARELYRTLHHKFALLPDSVTVYPTHGAGSFCNTTTTSERVTTIGNERATNPFFGYTEEEEFVHHAVTGLGSFPAHYRRLPAVNRKGARVLGDLPELKGISPRQVEKELAAGAVIVDVRDSDNYLKQHIPNSYGIPLFTPLCAWAGWVIPKDAAVILVGDAPAERREAALQLLRIGYDDLRGYLEGGLHAWQQSGLPIKQIDTLNADELKDKLAGTQRPQVLDVRFNHEWNNGHLEGAKHIEAPRLAKAGALEPSNQSLVVHCRTGVRSTLAVSLLEQHGFSNLTILREGIEAWKMAGYDLVKDAAIQ